LANLLLQLEQGLRYLSRMPETPAIHDNPTQNRFEAISDGHIAMAEYKLAPGLITFTHTLVPPELGGRGLGTALIRAGLASARERGLKVVPICPFFAKYIKEHAEEHDLLAPGELAKLQAAL
jgi:predicted GNAT family acetyltransferase